MFDYAAVYAAIAPEHVPADDQDIDLPQLDQARRLGIGRDGGRSFVFVGPGQPTGLTLEGRQFRFDPWTDLVDRRSSIVLKDVCVLRFQPVDDVEVRDAVAVVFAGLVELADSTPDALGRTIQNMEALFESGLRSHVSRDTEIGLAGELLVIAESADPSALAKTWHSKAAGQFDFSAQGERLEVKTTTGSERIHWFGSGQVAPIPGVCTSFVSVVLPIVETGSTVASVFATMSGLTPEDKARVRTVIIDTAMEPPEVITSVVFDRDAARASILHVASDWVPMPVTTPGVGRMRWEATIAPGSPGPAGNCEFARSLGI